MNILLATVDLIINLLRHKPSQSLLGKKEYNPSHIAQAILRSR